MSTILFVREINWLGSPPAAPLPHLWYGDLFLASAFPSLLLLSAAVSPTSWKETWTFSSCPTGFMIRGRSPCTRYSQMRHFTFTSGHFYCHTANLAVPAFLSESFICRLYLVGFKTQKTLYSPVVQVQTRISSEWEQKWVFSCFSSGVVQRNNMLFKIWLYFTNIFHIPFSSHKSTRSLLIICGPTLSGA